MDVEHVAVVGAGTMGSGIAQTFLQHGFAVTLIDQEQEQLDAAGKRIQDGLETLADKDALEQDVSTYLTDLTTATAMETVAGADVVLEAVPEDPAIKQAVFEQAAEHNNDAIYASNTSSIPIAELAEHVPDAENCVGMHFFNPAPVMDIVEVVTTDQTNEETLGTVLDTVEALDKEPAVVNDVPGFVSNRVLMPFINEAVKTVDQGIADKEAIDRIAEHGFNHPMGPLELADFIGLDVCLDIMERMYEHTGEDRFQPAALLREKVENEELGKKSGEGFYTY